MSTYSELLRHPAWQKKRLEVLERDDWTCTDCAEPGKTLNVHHEYYITGRRPWEYPDFCFVTVCDDCHKNRSKFSHWACGGFECDLYELYELMKIKGLEQVFHELARKFVSPSTMKILDAAAEEGRDAE